MPCANPRVSSCASDAHLVRAPTSEAFALALIALLLASTAQAQSDVDTDGNGDASPAERDGYARARWPLRDQGRG